MGRIATKTLLLLLCAAGGCASSPPGTSHADAERGTGADFDGTWTVEWCDRTNPRLDCGGFSITLVQEGDRLCGDYTSDLVNLRQVDEGRIVGAAVGDVAVLAVESSRSGAIALVRARRNGDQLHWKEVDSIRRSDGIDIDVIAHDDVLNLATDSGTAPRESCGKAGARPR